jgi:nitrile hydratase accessory protein
VTFDEPWQAQAFALAVTLQDRGVISEAEWSEALGAEIAAAPDAPYYECWLAALERLVASLTAADLQRFRHAWAHAAARTPHGMPIELTPGDF